MKNIMYIALCFLMFSTVAYGGAEEEIKIIKSIMPNVSRHDIQETHQYGIHKLDFNSCVLQLTDEYFYPEKVGNIYDKGSKKINKYTIPLKKMDHNSIIINPDDSDLWLEVSSNGMKDIVKVNTTTLNFNDGSTFSDERFQSTFGLTLPNDMNKAKSVEKSMKRLIKICE